MATLVKTPSGTWKAVIRKVGFPTATKTFRTKRDAETGRVVQRTRWYAVSISNAHQPNE